MTESGDGRGEAVDPLVIQAQKIFAQRQARLKLIDADLLGEPGWDIMLRAFIETRRGSGCRIDSLPAEISASPEITARWIAVLVERGMVERRGSMLALTENAETSLRLMFSAQLKEMMQEFGKSVPGSRSRG